ncbi:MAG: T9SS type A sorting domain-containing protein [Bacteroidia bacterium]|nr:T9SS type A sorting domain-containing protein [Bacteroidia bacterium]
MKYLPGAFACAFLVLCTHQHLTSQIVYAGQLIAYTSCGVPCNAGIVDPSASADGNTATYSEMRNNLGVGNYVSLETGFSAAASPEALVGVPIRKSGLLSDAALLAALRIELLDPSGNLIMQRNGLAATDLNVMDVTQNLYSVSMITPPGSYTIARVRISLGGILNLTSQVYAGDPFYVNAAAGCGVQYANTVTGSGTTGVCVLCSVSGAANVTDASLTNYATMSVPVGVGGRTYIEVSFPTGGNAGDYAGFLIGDGTGLLDVTLLGNIDIATYNGATLVETRTVSSLLGLALLSGGTPSTLVGFNASASFNRLRISMGALASVLASMRVYGAVKYDPTPPMVSVATSPDTVFCSGTAASLSATAGYTSYLWNTGQNGQVITPGSSGRYMVTGYNASGCPFYSAPKNITILPAPALPSMQAANSNCIGGNALVKAYPALSTLNYQLRVSGGAAIGTPVAGNNDTLRLFSGPILTNTSYTVEVTNPVNGCQAQVAIPVTVQVPAVPASVFSSNDQTGCWVQAGDRFVHFMQPGTDRIIASLNPKSSNLGWVQFTGYNEPTEPQVQACDASQPQFLYPALRKHWTISSDTAPTGNILLRFYMHDADHTSLATLANANTHPWDDINSVSDLKLTKYSGTNENDIFDDNCGTGVVTLHLPAESGSVTAGAAGFDIDGTSFSGFSVTGFSEFWLSGAGNSPLPVTIGHWQTGCQEDGRVRASWNSVSEVNNAFFILEASADEHTWTEVCRMEGAGNSNQLTGYQAENLVLQPDHSFLRLVQQDFNGERSVKALSAVHCPLWAAGADNEGWKLYPNPARDFIRVEGPYPQDGALHYSIMDITGKTVWQGNSSVEDGFYLQVPVEQLKSGLYVLRLSGAAEKVFRFQKR